MKIIKTLACFGEFCCSPAPLLIAINRLTSNTSSRLYMKLRIAAVKASYRCSESFVLLQWKLALCTAMWTHFISVNKELPSSAKPGIPASN